MKTRIEQEPKGIAEREKETSVSSVASLGPPKLLSEGGCSKHMHSLFEKTSGLTETIIGAAIEVHRNKGPGLIEFINQTSSSR